MRRSTSFDSSSASADAIQRQARLWLRTLASGDVKPWDAEAFKRWLHASPAHQQAFRDVRRRWDELGPGVAEMLRTNAQAAAFHERTLRVPRHGRRAFLGAAAGVAAAASVAVLYPPAGVWPPFGTWGADFHTAAGEQQALSLAHVNVTLNTQTRIRQQGAGTGMHGIELLAGEAAIDFDGAGRAFTVMAGAGRSTAQMGSFEVRNLKGRVCVTCIAGLVRIEHPAGGAMLQARTQAVYDETSLSGVAAVDPGNVSAWRRGELVFNHTRLGDVLDEINRYRPGKIMLLNDAAAQRPVTGRFVIAALDSALSQLQHNFDLHARSLPGGLLILS
ncbi:MULTISPECIES: DUF4880 domain-containing protein [Pigmentiphaga]|uniref:FecR domain-containing protein n=1 Tax=Pigmentiphaga daeguensis TaxID=414049 RepID=A0ABN1C5F8_9BURK|nr:DUF4880 domain-containing protein [Pigmentiphaga sp. D-2]